MKHRIKLIQASSFLRRLLCLPPCGSAQGLARIAGTVTDPTGAVVPNATVIATQISTGEKSTATTNGSGEYVFPSLAPGEYSINVTSAGFSRFQQSNVVLQADQALNVNATLKVGSSAEIVNVETVCHRWIYPPVRCPR